MNKIARQQIRNEHRTEEIRELRIVFMWAHRPESDGLRSLPESPESGKSGGGSLWWGERPREPEGERSVF
jgi:hypothetical protein